MTEPLVLGIESSCDETGVGIVRGRTLLANVIASSMEAHAVFGGVVPEIAARAHLEAMRGTLDEAVAQAAAAAAAAASAATEAAADVLPADVVAQATTEATDEVAADAAASGDPATVKAAEAVTDSGIIKDAVVEGTALAVEAKQAAGGSTLALLLGGAALLFLITRK